MKLRITPFVLVALLALPAQAAAAARPRLAPRSARVGDAYAYQGANACSWTFGTAAVQKTVTLSQGTFTLTSFLNKLTNPWRQYVDGTTSPEFSFGWDGTTITGATPGWGCVQSSAKRVLEGGEPALELDVTVARPQVSVTQHYVIYPGESLVRQWTDYLNTDSVAHTMSDPSFLDQALMGDAVSAGHAQLLYSTGGARKQRRDLEAPDRQHHVSLRAGF